MKRTPLYEQHVKAGGKMIDFGGWELPVQYSGIVEEHRRVRSAAGLFDVSHMGEILVEGEDAGNFINSLITNDIAGEKPGRIIYSPMCYPGGGVVDDLLVYVLGGGRYLLVVNASNTEKDFNWLKDNLKGRTDLKNLSADYAQLALQGPLAERILQKLAEADLPSLKFYRFIDKVPLCGTEALISRTGYTGEDGFEIYLSPDYAGEVWTALLDTGREEGLAPVGLGARDTLRFEAALPLYGHELSEAISPLEAGLDKFVKLEKESFTGCETLRRQAEEGTARQIVGLEMVDRGIPRSGYSVYSNGVLKGSITTGNYSPSTEKSIALALLDSDCRQIGNEVEVVIRNAELRAKVVPLPFYRKKYKK